MQINSTYITSNFEGQSLIYIILLGIFLKFNNEIQKIILGLFSIVTGQKNI